MIEIELWTGSGGSFVSVVDLPPFPHATLPEVVTWGVRTFKLVSIFHDSWPVKRPRYVEVFSWAITTPPPGRPLDAAKGP